MNKTNKFSPEVRERAVRLVQEHRGNEPAGHVTQLAAGPVALHPLALADTDQFVGD